MAAQVTTGQRSGRASAGQSVASNLAAFGEGDGGQGIPDIGDG